MTTAHDRVIRAEALFTALHRDATAQLLRLIEGFYSNIEDGLFELVSRTGDEEQRRRCLNLMRELRLRRTPLVSSFARAMDRYRMIWFDGAAPVEVDGSTGQELDELIMQMAEKSSSHFSAVLQLIAERAEAATGRSFKGGYDVPIAPRHVARAFVLSCRPLKLDRASIEIVQDLFGRFVLDGLGNIYGHCNFTLKSEGYATADELRIASSA